MGAGDIVAVVALSLLAVAVIAHHLLGDWQRRTYGRCPWCPTLSTEADRCTREAGHAGLCTNRGRRFYGINYTLGHTYVQFWPAPLDGKPERDSLIGWHPPATDERITQ